MLRQLQQKHNTKEKDGEFVKLKKQLDQFSSRQIAQRSQRFTYA